jgi:hypothetical protein
LGLDGGFLLRTPGILPDFGVMMRGLFMEAKLGSNGASIPAKTDMSVMFRPWRSLKLMAGLSKVQGDSILEYATGIECDFLWFSPIRLSFASGYRSLGTLKNGELEAHASTTSVGGSIRISRYKIDYAYEQHSTLDDTHRVTLGILQHSPIVFHMDRGREAFEQLNDKMATQELREVIYLSPRNVQARHLLALIYERSGHASRAIETLEKIEALDYEYFQEQGLDQRTEDMRTEWEALGR